MKFNERYFDELGHSAPVEALVVQKANEVAAAARAAAPVVTGDYRDKIHVEIRQTTHRVVAVVVADSDHSMIVEARHGTLARALRGKAHG